MDLLKIIYTLSEMFYLHFKKSLKIFKKNLFFKKTYHELWHLMRVL